MRRIRKLLSLFLALILAVGLLPVGAAAGFPEEDPPYDRELFLPLRWENSSGRWERYRYDEQNRLLSEESSDGSKTEYFYDDAGKLTHEISSGENSFRTDYRYNDLGQMVLTETSDGKQVAYTYNANGRVTKIEEIDGDEEEIFYDAVGRVTRRVMGTGFWINYSYDEQDNCTREENSDGEWTQYAYDARGNQTLVERSDGVGYASIYDDLGREQTMTDSEGNVVRYFYDEYGNRNRVTYPDGGWSAFSYQRKKSSEVPSAWAKTEVDAARAAGLIPAELDKSYTANALRLDFARLVTALLAARNRCAPEQLLKDAPGIPSTFSDCTELPVQIASAYGVIEGVGENLFAPTRHITRQEAATMLGRLADVLGLTAGTPLAFADWNDIDSWARDAVAKVSALKDKNGKIVMQGTGNSNFSPYEMYSIEQGICSFVRLYYVEK